jgi:hypothetical protein
MLLGNTAACGSCRLLATPAMLSCHPCVTAQYACYIAAAAVTLPQVRCCLDVFLQARATLQQLGRCHPRPHTHQLLRPDTSTALPGLACSLLCYTAQCCALPCCVPRCCYAALSLLAHPPSMGLPLPLKMRPSMSRDTGVFSTCRKQQQRRQREKQRAARLFSRADK